MVEKIVPATKFKANCSRLIEDVARKRTTLVITKRGKPIAKLLPHEPEREPVGYMKGTIKFMGDVISPVVPADSADDT